MEEEPQFTQNYEGKAGPRSPNSLRIMMENANSKQHDKQVNSDTFCTPGPNLDVDRSDVGDHEGPWWCSEEEL